MTNKENIAELIQYHNGIEKFNYNLAVDWAIDLIQNGLETDNVYMLASFTKPVEAVEIKPYVSAVLNDLNLEEKEGDKATYAYIHYHLRKILSDDSIRGNLGKIYQIFLDENCFDIDNEYGLIPFYKLYHGWCELEEIGVNYYFEGANLDNIEEVIKEQAKIWIDKNIHGIEDVERKIYPNNELLNKNKKKKTLLSKIKKWLS